MTKKAKWTLIVTAVVGAGTICGGIIASECLRNQSTIRFYSDMSFANSVIREELRNYYHERHQYPDHLATLTESILRTSHPRDAPQKTKEQDLLAGFEYLTDGETYTVTWSVKWPSGEVSTYKEYGRRGTLVRLETYTNGELSNQQSFMEQRRE